MLYIMFQSFKNFMLQDFVINLTCTSLIMSTLSLFLLFSLYTVHTTDLGFVVFNYSNSYGFNCETNVIKFQQLNN